MEYAGMLDISYVYSSNGDGFVEQNRITGEVRELSLEEFPSPEELYKKIQEEKEKLIREKKIKKEKPFPAITEEEIPFEIPEIWKWVRLGEIIWYLDAGKSPRCIKQNVNGEEWGVITTTAIQTNFFNEEQNKIRNIMIPFPPLEEQKRIVAKIEEMLPYCKQLLK